MTTATASTPLPSAEAPDKGVGCGDWFASVPPTKPGQCIEYLVTVEARNGKRFVQLAQHANTHWLPWDDSYDGDDIDEEGGKVWSGWLDVRQDRHGDDLLMEVQGTVVAWMPKPTAFLANAADEQRRGKESV